MIKIITKSPQETIDTAVKLGGLLKAGDMIAYKGGLGAGKTTFTRGIAVGLGLGDNVTSPTFALVNEYHGDKLSLYHFDMYRISGWDDLETTGYFEYLEAGGVLAVEWSENVEDAVEPTITITIRKVPEHTQTRIITITGGDALEDFSL